MSFEVALFYALGALALCGALYGVALARDLMGAAIGLLLVLVSVAGISVLLGAHVVAAFQILAGSSAALVLGLFATVLVGSGGEGLGARDPGQVVVKIAGGLLALVLAVAIAATVVALPDPRPLPMGFGGFRDVGRQLFTTYVVPVEMLALLLLSAVVGAVVLAKRRID